MVFEKIRDFYWMIVPHDFRPGEIWYRFKCWIYHRYSTVKSRYLSHTWVDKDKLLVHTMFEILSKYIEDEKPDQIIDWSSNETSAEAWEELNRLYEWWHKTYIPWTETYMDKYSFEHIQFEKIEETGNYKMVHASEEARKKSHETVAQISAEEASMEEELVENCKKLIDLKDYLWT